MASTESKDMTDDKLQILILRTTLRWLDLLNAPFVTAMPENEASKIGLRISAAKSKVMWISYARANTLILIGHHLLDEAISSHICTV